MPINITDVHVRDIRMPTSRTLAGSDAMHRDPDYSATYVVLDADGARGVQGHGLTFTIGRGNEVVVAAVRALAPIVRGRRLESITSDFASFWRELSGESQIRWIGQAVQRVPHGGSVEVRREVQQRYNAWLQKRLAGTVFATGCDSWYLTPDGRNTQNWPGTLLEFWEQTRAPDPAQYELL